MGRSQSVAITDSLPVNWVHLNTITTFPGGRDGTWTRNLTIIGRELCQLSYPTIGWGWKIRTFANWVRAKRATITLILNLETFWTLHRCDQVCLLADCYVSMNLPRWCGDLTRTVARTMWSAWEDSNFRPIAPKAIALSQAELHAVFNYLVVGQLSNCWIVWRYYAPTFSWIKQNFVKNTTGVWILWKYIYTERGDRSRNFVWCNIL